ncbi:uncharacterized protein LOC120362689 [Saimiri boliviensis]|uniref:uncharacterized protein LOC120362689 n=1 Tax=Saimiri boliviensis TaxID=27679 RepID=UPI003D780191
MGSCRPRALGATAAARLFPTLRSSGLGRARRGRRRHAPEQAGGELTRPRGPPRLPCPHSGLLRGRTGGKRARCGGDSDCCWPGSESTKLDLRWLNRNSSGVQFPARTTQKPWLVRFSKIIPNDVPVQLRPSSSSAAPRRSLSESSIPPARRGGGALPGPSSAARPIRGAAAARHCPGDRPREFEVPNRAAGRRRLEAARTWAAEEAPAPERKVSALRAGPGAASERGPGVGILGERPGRGVMTRRVWMAGAAVHSPYPS